MGNSRIVEVPTAQVEVDWILEVATTFTSASVLGPVLSMFWSAILWYFSKVLPIQSFVIAFCHLADMGFFQLHRSRPVFWVRVVEGVCYRFEDPVVPRRQGVCC